MSDTNQDQDDQKVLNMMLMGFEETPFHKNLGMKFTVNPDLSVSARIEKQQHLMGNVLRGMIHGGAIAGVFDAIGGATCAVNVYSRLKDLEPAERGRKLARLCTIDLKINYLAPARTDSFEAIGRIIKLGSSIIVVHMDMHDANGHLVATGNGNFMY